MNGMATVLQLAREIRHHIVSHSTGRLKVTYPGCSRIVDFSEGTIVSAPDGVLRCFEQAPRDFSFRRMKVALPNALQSGGALLIEAMESMDSEPLRRVWEPYKDWTILLPEDPEIHDTLVSAHFDPGAGHLRRMLRLAVSGVLTLLPPDAESMDEEMEEIRRATEGRDYWQVLGVARSASSGELRRAYRKRVRQFHPDLWHSSGDHTRKNRVGAAFRDVCYCYEQAQRAPGGVRSATMTPPRQQTISAIVARNAMVRTPIPDPQTMAPRSRAIRGEPAAAVDSYKSPGKTDSRVGDSTFRRILEKMIKAA